MAALWDWSSWSKKRQLKWAERVTIRTINLIVADLPELSKQLKQDCIAAQTLNAVHTAAADAAAYTAHAAKYAAYAASAADVDNILQTACQIWTEAVIYSINGEEL
jgi:hypothetical protein